MTNLKDPKVTFIVPCYKLARLLPDCVNSILSQSYGDFEVLIMDDCSPDNTTEVAQSFRDPRVKHVRNEINIGHIANFNKGISLARGKYIWLISADDRLRRPHVLERYVKVMDAHPKVGYVFCPAMGLQDGQETEVVSWSFHGTQDIILKGHDFLEWLIDSNKIAAPSGMVRKECYDIEVFPLDLPYSADWYMWCFIALYYDVAYFEEPMVNYRYHDLNLTKFYMGQGRNIGESNDIAVRWRIKQKAQAAGFNSIVRKCKNAIVDDYTRRIRYKDKPNKDSVRGLTLVGFEHSLSQHARSQREEKEIRAKVYANLCLEVSETYADMGDLRSARAYAIKCLSKHFLISGKLFKILLRLYIPTLYKLLRSLKQTTYLIIRRNFRVS